MPTMSGSRISCGVYQLYNLDSTSPDILKRLMSGYKHQARSQGRKNGFAQVIFSDAVDRDYWDGTGLRPSNGVRFAEYLRAEFPTAQLVELKAKRSPSTGNNIQTWIWNIPHPSFKRHKFYAKVNPIPHYRDQY